MEEKDELLEAFENPDMVDENVESESEVANEKPVEVVASEPPVENAQVQTEESTSVEEPVNVEEKTINNEAKEMVEEKVTIKPNIEEDTGFVKKNLTFLLIICIIIAVFIIFLPKILGILSGGRY